MKKIMFNDKYGLTQEVLEGRKTQTRRIIPLSEEDEEYLDTAFDWDLRASVIVDRYAAYSIDEEVAVAQSYHDTVVLHDGSLSGLGQTSRLLAHAGAKNKMFVKAEYMPHRIKINNVRVEHLQDISDADCLKEGIIKMYDDCNHRYVYGCITGNKTVKITPSAKVEVGYDTPKEAFAYLIDKICGKGTWESNPWVFVYDFELVRR